MVKTRSLTEGAMLTTLMVGLTYLSLYSVFISMLIPVPLILLVIRHGLRTGVLVSVVSALVSSLVFSSPLMAINLLITGLLGIALGIGLREGFGFVRLFLIGVGTSLVTFALRVVMYSILFGENLLAMGLDAMETSINQAVFLYESLGLAPDVIAQMEELTVVMAEAVRLLLPLGILMTAAIQCFANLFFVRLLVKRIPSMDVTVPWVPPFVQWRWPWYAVWGFILVRLLSIVPVFIAVPDELWGALILNLDLFFVYLFLLQGLAIVWFFLDKYNVSKVLRVIMILFLLLPGGPVTLVLALGGMLDTWFDFRKLNRKNEATEG